MTYELAHNMTHEVAPNLVHDLPILIVVIPLIAAFLIPIIGRWRREYCHYLSVFSILAIFVISVIILNFVMTPQYLFSVPMGFEKDLEGGIAGQELRDVFGTKGISLNEDAAVRGVDGGWEIREGRKTYSIIKEYGGFDSELNVYMPATIHYHIGGWKPPWGIEYVVDGLSAFVITLITSISLLVSIYAKKSVEKELPGNTVAFYTLFMLLIVGLLGIVITGDLFNLYVFLEISSLTAYALIAVGDKRDALVASFNYLIIGTIAACFILLGIGFLYMVTGSLNMADLAERLPGAYATYPRMVLAAMIFFIVGLSIKLALFPLHTWLPNAYTYAPSVVSALIAALMTKVGAYVMIRAMFTIFGIHFVTEVIPITAILAWVAAAAILVGSINAIAQNDIKRMLAYSSVSQIGYIVLGIGLSNHLGLTGAILHILNHAIMKGCLFLAVGAVIYKTGIRNINDFQGVGRKMPYTMIAFSIAALSMVGIPPLCGFFSKWFLALGAIEIGGWGWLFALVVLASSLLNAAYFLRVLEKVWFGKYTGNGGNFVDEVPPSMLIPTLIMAAGCILASLAWPFIESIAKTLI